ncbi:hypothetical protein H2201_008041 [Coniosporium apollinis]|uniref:C2H2-type domain-containing protein n=2 Tax=Coniosporium TaxID=2810619 RepID=A0ABQ9NMK6_9PEZI|nr:hypothetical protein H2199_004144 [Cladosporium sp. JES 115]KAJ9657828.1 hypothetical protein H2201_008041 [Coniosporium apollinis]
MQILSNIHSEEEQEASDVYASPNPSHGTYYDSTTSPIGQQYDSSTTTLSTAYLPLSVCTSSEDGYHSYDVNSEPINWPAHCSLRPSGSPPHSALSIAGQSGHQTQALGYFRHQISQADLSRTNLTSQGIADQLYGAYHGAAESVQQHSPQGYQPMHYSAASSYRSDSWQDFVAYPTYTTITSESQLPSPTTGQRQWAQDPATDHVRNTYQIPTDYLQPQQNLDAAGIGDPILALPFDQHSCERLTFPMSRTTSTTSDRQRSTSKPQCGRRTSKPESPESPASNETQHACHSCDASFKRAADLVRHRSSMHGENVIMFDCDFPGCNRRGASGFKRKDHLNEHKRNVHGLTIPKREKGQRSAPDPGPGHAFAGRGGYQGHETFFMD